MNAPHEHGDAAEEVRLLGIALLDRLQPGVQGLLAALREGATAAQPAEQPVACGWCPLCSAIALLRGERPELAAGIAEHADGLLMALRAVLEQPVAAPEAAATPATPATPPKVQRIAVRDAATGGGAAQD